MAGVQWIAANIAAGMIECGLAGGTESMSTAPATSKPGPDGQPAPWLSPGNEETPEAPPFNMALTVGDNTARIAGVTREEADEWAFRSHQNAVRAIDEGRFKDEVVPVPLPGGGEFAVDEHPRRNTSLEKLASLPLLNPDVDKANQVLDMERDVVDPLCDAIERFVDSVIAEDLADHEREQCFAIKNINVDLERVGDHCENLAEAAQDRFYHSVPFSDEALRDLDHAFAHVERTLETALSAVRTRDQDLATLACRMEDEMDRINLSARQGHLTRIQTQACNNEAGVIFIESLRNLERIGDHADNLAVSVLRK